MKPTLSLLTVLLTVGTVCGGDWSNWRGPEQDGVSRETGLPDKFDVADKMNVIWNVPIGGRTTPIVQKGHVYLINRTGDGVTQQERVMALDEITGKVLWEHKFNVWHTDIVADRLGWTNMVGDPETDTIFSHGTQGLLACFSRDGKVVWEHSLTEEFGRISGYGGRLTSPIIDGDLCIISMLNASWGYGATGRTRLAAFDKRTGKVVWWASTGFPPKNSYYSNPVVAVIRGERLVITGGGDGGVHAFKVHTGEKVWSYIFGSGDVNCSPVVSGDLVYIGHGEINLTGGLQGKVICLDASQVKNGQPKLVWERDGIKVKFTSPIFADGRLYVTNDAGLLYCFDGKTGKEHWKVRYGKNSKGSPVLADGKIYVAEEDGKFHILKPEDKKCTSLHVEPFEGEVINGSPAVANGRVLFMTTDRLLSIGLKNPGKPLPIPASVTEPAPAKGAAVTVVRVFPGEVVLHPGESADLKAFGFDEHGHPLGEVKVDWALAGSRLPEGLPAPPPGTPGPPALQGTLSEMKGSNTTKLTVAPAPPAQFGRVVAKLGKVEGEVRVRVAPKLPYKPDFSKVPESRTPGGWVNTQGKFGMVKLPDGSFALKKLAVIPSPLVARANAFIGTPDMKDYTIQADLMGTKVGDDVPDCGVVANRYTLMFFGNNKLLRLVSWDALPRIEKNIPWEFKPGTWYRLKLTVDIHGDKGVVRGKVWEADKTEPKEWTLEVEDPIANKEGAPALYANATGIAPPKPGTEVFFRNVSVIPNKAAPSGEKTEQAKPEAARPPQDAVPTPTVTCMPVAVECCPARCGLFARLRCR